MIVAFTTHQGDIEQLISLLKWCVMLGPQKDHNALIVADCATDYGRVIAARRLAAEVFYSARIVTNREPVKGWADGSKSLFLRAAEVASESDEPFLLMEPDAIPLRPGWVDSLAKWYDRSFICTGHVYKCEQIGLPSSMVSGIAVYSPKIIDHRKAIEEGGKYWDVAVSRITAGNAVHTSLIHHVWGDGKVAPTFAETSAPGTHVFNLDSIPPQAVIWHRNKDGTLIHQLRRKMFPDFRHTENITVVFPVCSKDIGQAIHHLKWLGKLTGKPLPHKAVLAFDKTCNVTAVSGMAAMLKMLFESVEMFVYPTPPFPGWPAAPNWAFQNVAHKMAEQSRPWLWMEADAVVLRADWLERIQAEYDRAGKPFMGPHVRGMNHSNGVMVYPHDTPTRIPSAMRAVDRAWDYECSVEMMPHCHDASHILQHIWTIANDMPSEVGGGHEPAGVTVDRAHRWINPRAVMVHRIKDQSLVDLLLRGEVVL